MNKKMKILDLFCGAGGLSLGFEKAGFQIVGGVEFDSEIIETHVKNFPKAINICDDIKKISNKKVTSLFKNKVDGIIGGPPCQGFSAANKQQSEKEKKEKNRLFYEYIRFIRLLKPKFFVIENVKQILTKENGYAKKHIYEITSKLGYRVSSEVLTASDYGVPQKRQRAIIVGIRKDLGFEFDFKTIKKAQKVNVYEAISDLYPIDNLANPSSVTRITRRPRSAYQILMRKNSKDRLYNHEVKYPIAKIQNRIRHVPQGGNWTDVPERLWDTKRLNRHSSAYRRLSEDDFSITIDTGHMNYFHPIYDRVPTVRESARLQSFPDDFIFVGNKTCQYTQVGNAVPPLMAQALAKAIRKKINNAKK